MTRTARPTAAKQFIKSSRRRSNCFGRSALGMERKLKSYLAARDRIRKELLRERKLSRIPVRLPSGETVTISPGGQNPLIKTVVEEFCPRFVPGGTVVYIGDAENKFLHLDADYLATARCRDPGAGEDAGRGCS